MTAPKTDGNIAQDYSIKEIKLIYDHAWNWFAHHAEQRMTALRFYLLLIGIFAAGFYQTSGAERYGLALSISIVACLFSLLFWRLDLRTRELIKVGEDLLRQTETRMESISGFRVRILDDVDGKSSRHTSFLPQHMYSYSQIFTSIFSIAFIFYFASAVYAFYMSGLIPTIRKYFT